MIDGAFELVDVTGVTSLVVDRISPDVRNRGTLFPALVYEMNSREYTESAAGSGPPTFATFAYSCMARTRLDAEALADAVVAAVADSSSYPTNAGCIINGRVTDRSAAESFERGGDSELVYISTVTAAFTGNA